MAPVVATIHIRNPRATNMNSPSLLGTIAIDSVCEQSTHRANMQTVSYNSLENKVWKKGVLLPWAHISVFQCLRRKNKTASVTTVAVCTGMHGKQPLISTIHICHTMSCLNRPLGLNSTRDFRHRL